jgi:quinol monooxygenase YgiN
MFGLVGKMRAAPGKRAELIAILGEGAQTMPGCIHYIVSEDMAEADAIWISEIGGSEESHRASLMLPEVKAAITRGRPLITGFDMSARMRPVAGVFWHCHPTDRKPG